MFEIVGESLAVLWKDWSKDMDCAVLSYQNHFSLSGTCPHCGKPTVFIMETPAHEETAVVGGRAKPLLYAVMKCSGCKKYILGAIVKETNTEWKYYLHYPLGEPTVNVSSDIPVQVRADLEEAIRCQWAKTVRAPIVMCRRAIEAACDNLLGTQSNAGIRAKIEELAKKGLITDPLKEWARRVQIEARAAAHPQEDGLDNMTPEDVVATLEFTQEFFEHVYVMPAKLKRAVERAEQKKGGSLASTS